MASFNILNSIEGTLKDWITKLTNLTVENVKGYEWEGEIEAGEEKKITHDLKVIPTRFVITESKIIMTLATGFTRATDTFFYIKNTASTSTFKGKILIMP